MAETPVNITVSSNPSSGESGRFARMAQRLRHPIQGAEKKPQVDTGAVKMSRNEFVVRQTTGTELDRHGRRREGTESEKATFNGEMMQQYSNFLEGYVRNLVELNKNQPAILAHPDHAHERTLLEMLSEKGTPSSEKIKSFLESHQGMAIATQVLEQQSALMLMGLGLDHAARWGERAQRPPSATLFNVGPTGIMRDRLGRILHIGATDTIGRWGGTVGGALGFGGGAVLGRMVGDMSMADVQDFIHSMGSSVDPGAAIGGVLGAGVGVAVARRFFDARGDIDLTACADALGAIQANPDNVEYLRAMTGINAHDFDVVGNRVHLTPGQVHETQNIRDVQRQIIQNLHTRRSFYEALGYPHTPRGRAGEQLFMRDNAEGREQMATRWQERINLLLDRNNPASAYNAPGITPEQRRELYLQVQQQVLNEQIQDYYHLVHGARSQEPAIKNLEAVVAKGKEGNKGKWESDHDKRIHNATQDRDSLQTMHDALYGKKEVPEGTISREQAQQELTEAQAEVGRIEPGKTAADIDSLRQDALSQISQYNTDLQRYADQIKTKIQDLIDDPSKVNDYTYQVPKKDKNGNVIGTTDITPSQAEVITGLRSSLTELQSTVAVRIQQLNERITKLDEVEKNIGAKQKQLNEVPSTEGDKFYQTSRRAYFDVIAATAAGPTPITEADLVNPALTNDQLLERINAAYVTGTHTGQPNEPWPATENSREDLRSRLLQARIEARVRADAAAFNPTQEQTLQQVIDRTFLDEDQIRNMDNAQIRQHFSRLSKANPAAFTGPGPTDAQLNAARNAATMRVANRKAEIEKMTAQQESLLKDLTSTREQYKATPEVQQVEMILDLVKRQGDIMSRTTDVDLDLHDVFDEELALLTDDLTKEEKDLLSIAPAGGGMGPPALNHVPRGYFETLNVLFDYQNKGAERGAYFQKIQSVLGPDRFAELANDALNLGLVVGGGGVIELNIENAMDAIQHNIYTNEFTQRQFRALSMHIINTLVHQARGVSV